MKNSMRISLIRALRKKYSLFTVDEAKAFSMDAALEAAKGDAILAAQLCKIGKSSMYRFINSKKRRK